jgi:hypothetical protein
MKITGSVESRESAALTPQTKFTNDASGGHAKSVMTHLVHDEPDQLVHVDIDGLERDGNVAGQALKGAAVIHRDELTRAIVAGYLALQFRMVGLRDHHLGLLEAGLLLGGLDDHVVLDLLVVGYEQAEVFAAPQRDHLGRGGLESLDQLRQAEELGLLEHVEGHVLRRQVIAAYEVEYVAKVFAVAVDKVLVVLVLDDLVPSAEHHGQHRVLVFRKRGQARCE